MRGVNAEAVALLKAVKTTTVLNRASVKSIGNRGQRTDRGRGMIYLMAEALASIGGAAGLSAAVAAFEALSWGFSRPLGRQYNYRHPVMLFASAGALQQLPFTDRAPPFAASDPPPCLAH